MSTFTIVETTYRTHYGTRRKCYHILDMFGSEYARVRYFCQALALLAGIGYVAFDFEQRLPLFAGE